MCVILTTSVCLSVCCYLYARPGFWADPNENLQKTLRNLCDLGGTDDRQGGGEIPGGG